VREQNFCLMPKQNNKNERGEILNEIVDEQNKLTQIFLLHHVVTVKCFDLFFI
jgi:hypothetical protein